MFRIVSVQDYSKTNGRLEQNGERKMSTAQQDYIKTAHDNKLSEAYFAMQEGQSLTPESSYPIWHKFAQSAKRQ